MTGYAVISHASLFANDSSKSERCLTSTPTRGGDDFGKELARSRRFGSSGLNLTSEGLLLGASLCLWVKGYLKQAPLVGLRIQSISAH
jgi:hypothetical protein